MGVESGKYGGWGGWREKCICRSGVLQEIRGPDVGGKMDPKEFEPDSMNWIRVVQNRNK
jgi:hypothetical protein